MDLGLGGRGYLVTGASRGLGFAAAQALVADGAAVSSLGGEPATHGLRADLAAPGAASYLTGTMIPVDGGMLRSP